MNFLNLLPELQLQIINNSKFAISAAGGTAASLRHVVEIHPAFKYSSTLLSLLKQSYEMANSKKIVGVDNKTLIVQEIAVLLATFDIKLAIRVVNSIQNEPEKSSAQKKLVQAIATFDKKEALELALTIHQHRFKAEALISVAEEYAIDSKIQALKIVDLIEPAEFKTQAYIKIATVRAIFDLDEAIELTQDLSVTERIKAFCEMRGAIGENQILAQKLLEKALKEVDSISKPAKKAEALANIVEILSEEDTQKAQEIKNMVLEMPASQARDLLFLSLFKFFLPLDYEIAISVFSLINRPNLKDSGRLEIVKSLIITNISKAREEVSLLKEQENIDIAMREIGLHLSESSIQEEIEWAGTIESKEHKTLFLRGIIKKYILNNNKERAFKIAFYAMPEGSPQQALALSDILKTCDLEESKSVLDFLEKLENSPFKALILLECAKEFANKDQDLATKMLDFAITVIKSLEDNLEKATFFIELAKMIHTSSWSLPVSPIKVIKSH